jgi:hypothetical protein
MRLGSTASHPVDGTREGEVEVEVEVEELLDCA